MDRKGIILETLNNVNVLEAKRGSDGFMRLSGTFGLCNYRNSNGRIYETKNYTAMVTEMQKRIETEGVMGELEHPNTMNLTLENVSHKIESINIDEEGKVTGTIVLLNTPKGQIAQSIVEGGLPLYISSRARGTVAKDGHVKLEQLATYDLVGTPGFSQARLDLAKGQTFECLNESMGFIYDEEIEQTEQTNEQKIENKNNEMDKQAYEQLEYKYNEVCKELDNLKESLKNQENIISEMLDREDSVLTLESVKDWFKETVAPAIQSWVVEEYSPEVQNWVVEEYSPEIQSWVVEEYSPKLQDWVVEEFAPEIQNWVVEEYTPSVDNWIKEELKPSMKDEIVESLNESKEESKKEKLSSIDSILSILENRKDNKQTSVIEQKSEDPYANVYCVEHMSEDKRPLWNMASQVVKESIISKSKLYDFTKEGVLESFWEKVDFTEPQAQINENGNSQKTITFGGEDAVRASLRMMGRKLGYRD